MADEEPDVSAEPQAEEPQEEPQYEAPADGAEDKEPEAGAGGDDLSDIRDQLKSILERLDANDGRIDGLAAEVKGIAERVDAIEAGGGAPAGGGYEAKSADPVKKPSRKTKKPAKKPKDRPAADDSASKSIRDDPSRAERLVSYYFGSRKLTVLKPTEGYPTNKEAAEKPKGKLELRKVHGYSGNSENGRQNLYLTKDGKYLIYFIAAVGIVYNVADGTQRFFTLHNDDITCVCIDPSDTKWVATGQKDPKDTPGQGKDLPKVWVWNYETMEKVTLLDKMCYGKINKVQWSASSTYLYVLCGDDDQTLKIFDPATFKGKKPPEPIFKRNTMRNEILGMVINPNSPKSMKDEFVVYGKRGFGHGTIESVKGKLSMKLKQVPLSSVNKDGEKAFTSCCWLPDGRYALGASSGSIYIVRDKSPLGFVKGAHDRTVGALLVSGNRLVSAGFDKTLKKWTYKEPDGKDKKKSKRGGLVEKWSHEVEVKESDFVLQPKAMAINQETQTLFIGTKTNQVLQYEMKSEESKVIVDGHDGSTWALATHPEQALFATGGYDNAIKVWDAPSCACIKTLEFPLEMGSKKGKEVSIGAWSNDGTLLAFGTEDSNIAIVTWPEFEFQGFTNIPPKSKKAEVEAVAYCRFSDDNKYLAVAHMDANLYVFDVVRGDDGITLKRWAPMNHVAAPTNLQWSADGTMIKTITRDYEIVHWELNFKKRKGKFVPNIPDPDEVKWADDPLIAGWDTQGLYQSQLSWDGTDLNDATVTSDGRFVASGDDYGCVRLHNYPAIDPTACYTYTGHAEFVVGVEFLRDDTELITCGGHDMAIFQWTLHKN